MIRIPASLFRIWLIASLLLLLLQSDGEGLPHDRSTFFYIGYFSTPFLLGLLIALVVFLVFNYLYNRK